MSDQKKVTSHFDALAPEYLNNFVAKKSGKTFEFRKREEIVTAQLSGRPGSLLDCACGTGEITAAVLKSGGFDSAVICDISKEMVSFARRALSGFSADKEILFVNEDVFDYTRNCG